MKILRGIPASKGIASGPAFQFKRAERRIERYTVSDPQAEIQRLASALEQGRKELALVLEKAQGEVESETASIFEAHVMMLEDPDYLAAIQRKIENEALNAEAAVADATEMYAGMLEVMEDEYLRARAADIRDVGMRLVRILSGEGDSPTGDLVEPAIILARELTPSDTISLDKTMVLGFCTVGGGPTAHVAILARELGLPAVVGIDEDILSIPDGCPLVIDGSEGTLLVEPDAASLDRKQQQADSQAAENIAAVKLAKQAAVTRDGQRIEVAANIGNIESAELALDSGAEGVGLLRTEFLYLERSHMPDEEEQYRAYRAILDVFGKLPVILRTLDIGGDKELPYLNLPREVNPFLGFRAIRLCLARPEIFKPQLKAALRAGVDRNLKLMFPMVATVGEVRAARALLDECRDELAARGQAVGDKIEVGIMVEIPAAVVMADQLAAEVDFFSIGTNDLSQYTMAADRTSSSVSALADAFQPAVLRLVRDVVQAAHQRGKWVGMCGELAGEPLAIPLLVGLGLDELSMNPPAIPLAKQIVRGLTMEEARQIARTALEMESPDQIREWLEMKTQRKQR
jgi:phosphoenolpyruvate-protein phosphotransferase